MAPLTVKILGHGNAAKKHKAAFAELPELYQITESDTADIIDICTPPYLHFPQAKEALLAGCHAIVEKPVCGSISECDELLELEKQTGKKVCPVFQYRFANSELAGYYLYRQWERPACYYKGWRNDWGRALGGCLVSHGAHLIDLVLAGYSGMPNKVAAYFEFDPWAQVETESDVKLYYDFARIHVVTVVGPQFSTGGFRLGNTMDGYLEQFRRTHDSLVGHGLTPVMLSEARNCIEVLTAAYYSAYTGEPVTLPIPPEHPFFHGWTAAFAERASRPDTRSQACR